ncbi:MAG: hypothetical protein ABL901_11440 [Hyphomicrobiaceae bacterium]
MKRHIILFCLPLVLATATGFSAASQAQNVCRQFLPAAGVVIQVACAQGEAIAAEPAVVHSKPSIKLVPAVQTVSSNAPVASPVVKPVAITKASSSMKTCVEILERAQSGKLLGGDVEILRDTCQAH